MDEASVSDLLKLGSFLLSASVGLLAHAADLSGPSQQVLHLAALCLHLSCPENIVALAAS